MPVRVSCNTELAAHQVVVNRKLSGPSRGFFSKIIGFIQGVRVLFLRCWTVAAFLPWLTISVFFTETHKYNH
jgi:hypothetical protein